MNWCLLLSDLWLLFNVGLRSQSQNHQNMVGGIILMKLSKIANRFLISEITFSEIYIIIILTGIIGS